MEFKDFNELLGGGLGLGKMRVKRFDDELPLPKCDEGDVGYDLYVRSVSNEFRGDERDSCLLRPGEDVYLNMNVAVESPQGTFLDLRSRSDAFNKMNVKLTNSVGTIDPKYRGDGDEIVAHVHNTTNKSVQIKRGDSPFQLVCLPYITPEVEEVDNMDNEDRGGFGTTD